MSYLIDYTSMKKWLPDYSTESHVIDNSTSLADIWTASEDGFIRVENFTYNTFDHAEGLYISVNGVRVLATANEAKSRTGAIANMLGSGPIPVCKGDVVRYETTSGNQHNMYFYKGKWV